MTAIVITILLSIVGGGGGEGKEEGKVPPPILDYRSDGYWYLGGWRVACSDTEDSRIYPLDQCDKRHIDKPDWI